MKKLYTLFFAVVLSLTSNAQTEWTGPTITVTKANFADWTLEGNQDRITANVWLTRADSRGLFNIVTETDFDNNNYTSPADTEWANGTIADGVGTLTFTTWDVSNGEQKPTIGQNKVLHLITDNIYIDFVVTAWTQGDGNGGTGGGGFTYERSTDQSLSTTTFSLDKKIKLFPNPSKDFIQVSGLTKSEKYSIYGILGKEVLHGSIANEGKIEIQQLTKGIYFLKLNNGNAIKFFKE